MNGDGVVPPVGERASRMSTNSLAVLAPLAARSSCWSVIRTWQTVEISTLVNKPANPFFLDFSDLAHRSV